MGPPRQFALNKTPPARPNIGFNICHLSLFPLGSADSRVIFILAPPGQCSSECWSKLEPFATPPRGNLRDGFSCTDCSSGVPWERDMCSSYRDLLAQLGGLAGLVLPLSKCPVTEIPRLIGSFREKEYPSLIMRACDGLSWDTPVGIKLSRVVPAIMWQMGIC